MNSYQTRQLKRRLTRRNIAMKLRIADFLATKKGRAWPSHLFIVSLSCGTLFSRRRKCPGCNREIRKLFKK